MASPSTAAIRTDLSRLHAAASATAHSDASAFRTAVRNIVAACRASSLALAAYCREGVLGHLAAAMPQVCASPHTMRLSCLPHPFPALGSTPESWAFGEGG
eukprot:scaffold102_cov27-Tisochrysis_lutea.AAC.1